MSRPLTECQIFLTRGCQLRCHGCQVVRVAKDIIFAERDATIKHRWLEQVPNRLQELGIQTVKILGGEPTLVPYLPEFVQELTSRNIKSALLSNGILLQKGDRSIYDACAKAGLTAVFPSVDSPKGSSFSAKANPGWLMINWAKEMDIPIIGANLVLTGGNINTLVELIQELHEADVRVNLCAMNYLRPDKGEKQVDFEYRMEIGDSQKLDSQEAVDAFVHKLYELGLDEAVIGGKEYLESVRKFSVKADWTCNESNQLRLDYDASLMLCLDRKMKDPNTNQPVLVTDNWDWTEYHNMWHTVRNSFSCECVWSAPMLAKQRMNNGTLDLATQK